MSAETPLGRMDGGGKADTGRLADKVGGESDREVTAGVPDGQVAVSADAGDGPAVAVPDPVGGTESESAVVGAGDDDISDTGLVPVSQVHLSSSRDVAEVIIASSSVQVGDRLPGRGQHDRVQSGSFVTQAVKASSRCLPTWTQIRMRGRTTRWSGSWRRSRRSSYGQSRRTAAGHADVGTVRGAVGGCFGL